MNEWDKLTQREKGIVREAMEFAYENFSEGDKRSGNPELGSQTATASQWMAMIKAKSVPSMISVGGNLMNGVEACEREK